MDDKAGRAVARRLGVAVIGSVGVLVLAKRNGLLPQVRPLLEALVDGGYFLAPDIVKEARRLAGE
jgi:predicted nucleic acid-binding protein